MQASTYAKLTLNVMGYHNPRPLLELKTRLDQIYFGDNHRPHQWFLTANGRSAIYLFLKSLNLPQGSEVIIQSFTCVAAINPILWAGLKPIYADIDPDTLSAAPDALQKLVSPQTRVLMLQHTFGIPGALPAVHKLAQQHNLIVIEDCAHALGATYDKKPLGSFGDAAIISFGIEKSLSTKLGGALLVNNPDLIRSVESDYRQLPQFSRWQSFLWLLYPGIRQGLRQLPMAIANPIRRLFEAIGLLKTATPASEYQGRRSKSSLATLPGVHAKVILDALNNLDANLEHRQQITAVYQEWLAKNSDIQFPTSAGPLIKFPVVCISAELCQAVTAALTEKSIYVTDWYRPPIYPAGVDHAAIDYQPETCPVAESVASRILNLPTGQNIDTHHATMIANVVNAATAQFAHGTGESPHST